MRDLLHHFPVVLIPGIVAILIAYMLDTRMKNHIDEEKVKDDDRFWVRNYFFGVPPPSVLRPDGFVLFRWWCVCVAIFAANILLVLVFWRAS